MILVVDDVICKVARGGDRNMAQDTNIEWTDRTFNPWTGCTKISPGCDHCYAEGWSKRKRRREKWGNHPRKRTTEAYCEGILWHGSVRQINLNWPMSGASAFFAHPLPTCSTTQVATGWRSDLLRSEIRRHSGFGLAQLLTKRVRQNMAKMLAKEPEPLKGAPDANLGAMSALPRLSSGPAA